MNIISKLSHFFTEGLWKIPYDPKRPMRSFFYQFLRVLISSVQGFINDSCFIKAYALAFYSLLTIVPLLAIGFGIAQELGLEEVLEQEIMNQFHDQPQVAEKMIQFSTLALKETKGGIIASFGLVVLLWSVFSMISSVATFFDQIWHVKKMPSLWRQALRYIPCILLFPLLLIGINSSIIFMSTVALLPEASFLSPFLTFFFKIIPYLLCWAVFTFTYIYIPNTKVTWKASIIAGLVAAILFQIWQWVYVNFQLHAASYGAIYGSFAAIPLFLIWLNYSWLIVLFGTEISYNIQKANEHKLNTK